MPSNLVTNINAAIVAAAVTDIQPPAGQAWVIYEVASEEAGGFMNAQPDLSYAIADGILTEAIIVIDPFTAAQKGERAKEIYITPTNYLAITNTGAGNANVGFTGERVDPNTVITDMVTCPTAGLGYVDVQPPAGQTWRITELGSELYNGGQNHPEVTVHITDGTLVASMICQEAQDRGWYKLLDWIIDINVYLRFTNTATAVDVDIAYSGILIPQASIGSIQDVVGSATLDIQPPAGQEWVITEIATEQWAGGGAPNDYPDIDVSLYDGGVEAEILEAGAGVSLAWNRRLLIHIDNATYLRITEVSTNDNEVGILGYLKRSFS